MGEVVEVGAVGVCFALKGDIAVGRVPVAVLTPSDAKLDQIEEVERDKQQFALLGRMYALMVDDIAVKPVCISCPECSEQIYTPSAWYQAAFYDFHFSDRIEVSTGLKWRSVQSYRLKWG